jgi:hypothetical protein
MLQYLQQKVIELEARLAWVERAAADAETPTPEEATRW